MSSTLLMLTYLKHDLSMKKYVKHSFYIVCYKDTDKVVFYTYVR